MLQIKKKIYNKNYLFINFNIYINYILYHIISFKKALAILCPPYPLGSTLST